MEQFRKIWFFNNIVECIRGEFSEINLLIYFYYELGIVLGVRNGEIIRKFFFCEILYLVWMRVMIEKLIFVLGRFSKSIQ